MNIRAVAQELTDHIVVASRELGFNTGINANQITEYPFVIVHRARLQFVPTKNAIYGRFFIDVDIWGEQPSDTAMISDQLMSVLLKGIKLSNGTRLKLDLNASAVRVLDELDPEFYRNLLELQFTQI